jgi:anti-sigma factor RsiW
MNCQKAGDLLSAYIDGELAGRQVQAVETHLTACAGCREELETLRSALLLLEAPKTPVRPEGLLEEFKAQYLPRAEAASAPLWGFRLPALPKMEWPSLGRVLVPMGGMAAAAATLLVVMNSRPAGGPPPAGPAAVASSTGPATRVAHVPGAEGPAVDRGASVIDTAVAAPVPSVVRERLVPDERRTPVAVRSERRQSRPLTAKAIPASRRRARRSASLIAAAPRPVRRNPRRSPGTLYARQVVPAAPVTDTQLLEVIRRHEAVEPSEESRWSDQVVVFRRKAAAEVVEEGFAEVTCKNLKTGQVKSMTIGSPVAPAGSEPAPIGGITDH